jgi:anti-anti-sigma regulatory factor
MFQVAFDKKKSLLKISFAQHVGEDEAKVSWEKVEGVLADVQQPFQLLTDLSEMESMDLACRSYIDKTMDLCNQKGVQSVVRVIPDQRKDIGLNIMSLFHYGRGVRIVTCETMEQARQALASYVPKITSE